MAERKIEGETYRAVPIAASEAIELYADLMRVATQGTGRIPGILLALEEQEGALAEAGALAAIGDILQKNTSAEIRQLIQRIATSAEVLRPSGYARIDFDEEFTGRLAASVAVVRFVLEVNFSDFFPASLGSGILGSLRAGLASKKSG